MVKTVKTQLAPDLPTLGRPLLNVTSVSRSYAIVATLEKVATEAWQHQLNLTVQDMEALHVGQTTPRLVHWFAQRKAVESQIMAQLMTNGGDDGGIK